ncbi:alpha/beta fold hydrolase [Haloarchaeobius amylolyticus]|uniref:alpha/beta fold hydrolase n=1 Tax=Haloarchaeobius amylolyticus TaxID=1198296 RepID=UPI00226D5CEB|nr:alpha/beta fold hydrolase [Haloarchaeobius amylolyticus]
MDSAAPDAATTADEPTTTTEHGTASTDRATGTATETRPRSRYLDLAHVRLHYLAAGEETDPPVVLLHGGGLDEARLSWRHLLPALADEHHVLAPDWPGYGSSGPASRQPSLRYYADVLAEFCDELGLERVSLVGISMGGGIALQFATDHTDRVERLVLVDSYGLGTSVPGGRLAYWFTRAERLNRALWWLFSHSDRLGRRSIRSMVVEGDDDLEADALAALQRPDVGEAWHAFQRHEVTPTGLRTAFLDRLPDLDVPTLVVHGERDPLVPVDWAIRAHAMLPDAELFVLPGCGHMPPRERPESFADRVRAFLG